MQLSFTSIEDYIQEVTKVREFPEGDRHGLGHRTPRDGAGGYQQTEQRGIGWSAVLGREDGALWPDAEYRPGGTLRGRAKRVVSDESDQAVLREEAEPGPFLLGLQV